jgi:uncharacterized DUF497 family protein
MRQECFSTRAGRSAKTRAATPNTMSDARENRGPAFRNRLYPARKVIRLISARKANGREQGKYDETLST